METFALTGASISLLQKRGEKVSRRRLSFLRLVAALLASAASSSSAAGECCDGGSLEEGRPSDI